MIYITDACSVEDILGHLWNDSLRIDSCLARGQLVILARDETYTREGVFDPERMIALLQAETERALAEGYPVLRVTSEMTWALRGSPGSERLMEYEARLNEFLPSSKCLAICQYDRQRFDPAVLLNVLRTHPTVIVGTELYGNAHYLPPAELLSGDSAATLRSWLSNLDEWKQSQDETREAREYAQNLIDSSLDMIIAVDQERKITEFNKAAVGTFGYSRKEVMGRHVEILYSDPEEGVQVHQIVRRTGRFIGEITNKRKNGETFPCFLSASTMHDSGGEFAGVMGISRDITGQKRAEDDLRMSERKYRDLVENINEIIYATDRTGVVTYISPVVTQAMGYDPSEIIGHSFTEFICQEDLPRVADDFQKLVSGQSKPTEYRVLAKSGEVRWVRTFNRPVYKENRITGVQGAITDITKRKQAEEALRESEANLSALIENTQDLICSVDAEYRVLAMNDNFKEKFSLAYGVELEKGMNILEHMPPDRRAFWAEVHDRTLKGEHLSFEQHHDKEGVSIDIEVSTNPIIGDDGKVSGVSCFAREVTERRQMLETLAEERNLLRTLIDNVPDQIYAKDTESRFILANASLVRLVGATAPEDLVGKTDFDFFPQEASAHYRAYEKEIMESGQPVINREEFGTSPTGSQGWVLATKVPLRDSKGKIIGLVGINRDITERKQAEEELIRLYNAVNMTTDSVVIGDLEAKIIDVNEATLKMYGTDDKGDLIGRNSFDLIAPEDREKALTRMEEVLEKGYVKTEEYDIITKDGSRIPVEMSGALMKDADGKPVGFVAVSRDITERKRAEAALAAEKEHLAVTLRSIGDGVITCDTKGKVVLVNGVAEKLTGWTEEEAIGKPLKEVFQIINEDTRERCQDPVKIVLKTGRIVSLANRTVLIAKDGTERIIADSAAPIRDRDSNVIGVVLVFRDVTEKRKIEAELRRVDRLDSVGILAGGIAHDFNNVLTAILGNVSLARLYEDVEDKNRKISEAERACMQAKNLTQRLLTFSKGGTPVRRTTSVAKLLRDSAELALSGSNVRCEFSIPNALWPVEVDEGQMNQVISNIIINADQAMPEGGVIEMRVENIAIGAEDPLPLKDGEYVKISIQDHGVGIRREHLQKIFDPYFTTKQKGSGLGLATSYSIVKNHDGHISVESQLGVGTTFHIYLPASLEGVLTKEEEEVAVPIMGEGKVLVMDDEKYVRDLAAEMLSSIGYRVTTAIDGAEAVEIYRQAMESGNPFDAAIVDLTVPGGMGGEEAVRRLTDIDPEVKAIVSSGYSNDPIMANFRKYGFKGVIAKPYKTAELSEVLHRVITEAGD